MKYRPLITLILILLQTPLRAGADVKESVSDIFLGVRYIRREQTAPEKQVSHIVKINLNTPGIRFGTTPGNGNDGPRETWCETTLDYVKDIKAQIGINGNFFINDTESHTELLGLAVSKGEVVSPWDRGWAKFAVNIAEDNKVTFVERAKNARGTAKTTPEIPLYNALSGNLMLVRNGMSTAPDGGDRHPRTGIGLTADNNLLLLIVDGRQPEYSVGMTYKEMADAFLNYGAVEALSLDGGGSTTLVIANPTPQVVNVPIPIEMPGGFAIGPPGIERKNGNNLAVFAAPLQENAVKPVSPP